MITDAMVEAAVDAFERCDDGAAHIDDKIRTALEAADAAAWQPIETAPKDRTHILVGTFPAAPGHVTITTAHWFEPLLQRGQWALSVNYDGEHSDHGVEAPTHWRPLPEPPTTG